MDGGGRPRVVVVEDDRDVATLVTEILNDEGFDAVAIRRDASASDVSAMRPRLVILDLFLGRLRAHDVLTSLRRAGARVPVLLLSAAQDGEEEARSLGASAFLPKPFDIDELVRTCRGLAA